MNLRRVVTMVMVTLLMGGAALHSHDANPISTNPKASWTNIRDLLTKMADKMPEENYRFKPTPDVQDFGQRMTHIIGSNMQICAVR